MNFIIEVVVTDRFHCTDVLLIEQLFMASHVVSLSKEITMVAMLDLYLLVNS